MFRSIWHDEETSNAISAADQALEEAEQRQQDFQYLYDSANAEGRRGVTLRNMLARRIQRMFRERTRMRQLAYARSHRDRQLMRGTRFAEYYRR